MWEKHLALLDTVGSVVLGGILYLVSMIGVLHDIIMESRDGFTLVCAVAMVVGMGLASFGLWRKFLVRRRNRASLYPLMNNKEPQHVW